MKLKRIIKGIFFPARCETCGRILPFMKSECDNCGIDVSPLSTSACQCCGHEKCICEDIDGISLEHFTAVYYYQGTLKESILRYKFHSESYLSHTFGKAMAERILEIYSYIQFDGICYVPMTQESERIRSYNQSELMAKEMAKSLSLPLVKCLEKVRDTSEQKELNATERAQNIQNCFAAKNLSNIKGKTLILCDDIKTTGSTLRECTDTLMKAGAKDVYCICLALTPYLNLKDLFG